LIPPLKIKLRLWLLGLLPATAIGLALTAYFVTGRIVTLDAELRERGDLIAKQLAIASKTPIAGGDRRFLRELADAVAKEKDVIEADIFDDPDTIDADRRFDAAEISAAIIGDRLIFVRPIPLAMTPPSSSMGALAPAPSRDARRAGYVKVVLSRASTLADMRDAILSSLGILLGGLVLASGLASRIGGKIGSPVLALTRAMHDLSRGRLHTRVSSPAVAELAYLQAGFNAMAADLEKNRKDREREIEQATFRLREALEALEKRNRELDYARGCAEAQTQVKADFLAQLSHEIRTPMNGILGFAELLGQTQLSQEQAEKLGLIERSAKNLLSILNEILSLSKLEAGKITLNLRQFDLRSHLEDVISLLSVRASRPPILLWIEPSVPKNIVGDPIRIQQVINNLLSNALKFARRGKILVRVRVLESDDAQERLMFSVSDSGPGISPKDLGRLFAPFQQLNENGGIQYERGAGLGLSIAKNIVEKMSGEMRVASRHGKGTTFWFSLPLSVGVNEFSQTPEYRAILISADPLARQAFRFQLEAVGARTQVCASPDDLSLNPSNSRPDGILVFDAGFLPKRQEAALNRALERCARMNWPVALILPGDAHSLTGFYREKGCICLSPPVRSESLRAALRKIAHSGDTEATGELVAVGASTFSPETARVFLVADDTEINRLLMRSQLSKFGAHIVEARDGGEALQKLASQKFDMVFLDLQMPVLDGEAVLKETRASHGPNRDAPIIAITAFAQPHLIDKVMRAGFTACLLKPILEDTLAALLSAHFGAAPRSATKSHESAPHDIHVRALLEKTQGDRRLAGVLAVKLFEELPAHLSDLEAEFKRGEMDAVRRIVHRINGASGFCGLQFIRQAAAEFEAALAQKESADILWVLRQKLLSETEHFLSRQTAIMDSLSPPMQLANRQDAEPMLRPLLSLIVG
jgi:two-component system sensor histidine kinase BarA